MMPIGDDLSALVHTRQRIADIAASLRALGLDIDHEAYMLVDDQRSAAIETRLWDIEHDIRVLRSYRAGLATARLEFAKHCTCSEHVRQREGAHHG